MRNNEYMSLKVIHTKQDKETIENSLSRSLEVQKWKKFVKWGIYTVLWILSREPNQHFAFARVNVEQDIWVAFTFAIRVSCSQQPCRVCEEDLTRSSPHLFFAIADCNEENHHSLYSQSEAYVHEEGDDLYQISAKILIYMIFKTSEQTLEICLGFEKSKPYILSGYFWHLRLNDNNRFLKKKYFQ